MKSRWITNFLLVMAIGILSLIARYLPGINEPAADEVYLTTLKANEIERIQIDRNLLPQLVLVKKDSAWFIDQQPPLPADSLQVNSLTRLAEQTVTRGYAITELDLAQIELASPEIRIMLNQQQLEFGGIDPLEGLRYVRNDKRVNLIEDLYKNQLESVYTRFIRRRLFAENEKITAIKLADFQANQIDGKWQLSPETTISADKLQLFIETWQQASALNIQKIDLEQTTGESVSVTLAGQQQPVNFVIKTRETELILARPDYGIQYKLGNRGNEFLNLPGVSDGSKAELIEKTIE